ncbi:hypothetical protein M231_00910 [Tremella mesenterica]|uniref:Uncharacterized protein n=1 Tax=Tremella mesenterica TaxID=5217 RepID=A0A4Q1BUE1_TREME|nr:hypothetical protein M231_00910 [Tremella mesenterica]
MACVPTPTKTVYETTQIPSITSYSTTFLSTYFGAPTVSYSTLATSRCDAFGLACVPTSTLQPYTVTPTETKTVPTIITTSTLVTSLVPVSTKWSTCPPGADDATPSSSDSALSFAQFSGAVTMPSSSSSPLPSTSNPNGSDATNTPKAGISSIQPVQNIQSNPASDISVGSGSTTQGQGQGQGQEIVSGTETITATTSNSHSSVSANGGSGGSSGNGGTGSGADKVGSHKSTNGAVITGTIVGVFVLLALGSFLFITLRRYCKRREREAQTWGDEYWERRFQELEAEGGEGLDGEEGHEGSERRRSRMAESGQADGTEKIDLEKEDGWMNLPSKKLRASHVSLTHSSYIDFFFQRRPSWMRASRSA